MNQETFLTEMKPSQRRDYLETNAAKIDTGKYQMPLTEDEIIVAKDKHVDNSIKLGDLQAELDEKKKEFKEKMEPMQLENKMLLGDIRTKQHTTSGTLYHLPDYENGELQTYNQDGKFISSRKLRPDEKQGGLFQMGLAQ